MDDKYLERTIYHGEEAKRFLSTQFGQMVIARAKHDANQALSELATVDPNDVKEIVRLQNAIRVAESVPLWVQDVIADGAVAYDEYTTPNQ